MNAPFAGVHGGVRHRLLAEPRQRVPRQVGQDAARGFCEYVVVPHLHFLTGPDPRALQS